MMVGAGCASSGTMPINQPRRRGMALGKAASSLGGSAAAPWRDSSSQMMDEDV